MPNVNGKKFPYTSAGMKAAKLAKNKVKKKVVAKKPTRMKGRYA